MNTLLQAQLSHKICSFKGRGMILIFTGFVFFCITKEKDSSAGFMGGTERKEGEREKSYFSSKMSKVLTTIKLTDIWR